MEAVNKSGKRRRGKCRLRELPDGGAPPDGRGLQSAATRRPEQLEVGVNRQGLSSALRLLVESMSGRMDSSDPKGHTVMYSQSQLDTSTHLRCLLANGADVSVTTDSGQTPLHLAASEGLLDCTQILVQAGADVTARDGTGHTPLDLARIWCHREVARYLKSCMWEAGKKKEMEERKLAQALRGDLVAMAKLNELNKRTLVEEKLAEWANKKGLPHLKGFSPRVLVSQYHDRCLSSDEDSSDLKQAKGLVKHQPRGLQEIPFSPWTIYTGLPPGKSVSEPDLRDSVTVWRDSSSSGRPQYTTSWDGTPRAAPDLPLDVLERVLFPRAFPSRIVSLRHFEPQSIVEVRHRGRPRGRSLSPWTEAAMHLAEVLEPGHY
ncbi:putative ankyrin repeat domain-containing protein 53 [Scophthalmus maximus]|uniref:Putative ankyrin repeat domain-containing protein 53 n=1 Tax=Scophthalmus maximus TaxID=52904 RepID=A0A2U9B0T4_SCOMX|nr:putative ankyrin repeat domain-containing protein 53 [Scophthalmus maximus]